MRMSAKERRITVVCSEEEYAELRRLADGRPLSRYLKTKGLENAGTVRMQEVAAEDRAYTNDTPMPTYVADVSGLHIPADADGVRVAAVTSAPRGDRRERVRTPGRFKQAVDVAHKTLRNREMKNDRGTTKDGGGDGPAVLEGAIRQGVPELRDRLERAESGGESSPALERAVRHTAESNRLTCLCGTCVKFRAEHDIPVGGLPAKKKR